MASTRGKGKRFDFGRLCFVIGGACSVKSLSVTGATRARSSLWCNHCRAEAANCARIGRLAQAPSASAFCNQRIWKASEIAPRGLLPQTYRGRWANAKGPRIPGFSKISLLQIQGFRLGNLEGSARYLC